MGGVRAFVAKDVTLGEGASDGSSGSFGSSSSSSGSIGGGGGGGSGSSTRGIDEPVRAGLGLVTSDVRASVWSSLSSSMPYGLWGGKAVVKVGKGWQVGVDAIVALDPAHSPRYDKFNLRACYAGRLGSFTTPQHYQATLSCDDLGSTIRASYYQHISMKGVGAAKNAMAWGVEVLHGLDADRL